MTMEYKEYNWDYLNKKAYNNTIGRYRTAVELKFITKYISDENIKILDIAGGSGRIAIPLIKYAKDITVTDINTKAMQILDERDLGIKTIDGDFSETDFHHLYALILCIEGPDYFKDWDEFFGKISSLLEERGKCIFTYTNPQSWRYMLRRIKSIKKDNRYHVLSFEELQKLLLRKGFEIKEIRGFNWMPFSVASNSPLVNFFAYIERKFKLYRWHSQSPWMLISIKKTTKIFNT
jgi:2-polyprenyl-3-methyl-5-hydroxy-6-metoxy-1,4-benzoquinol methylase